MSLEKTKILSSVPPERFIGRTTELDQLLRHADGQNESSGMAVLAAPGVGLTELLSQTYDQLFYNQGDVIPFYFQFKKSDQTPDQLAVRFLQSFLQQVVAFRRKDPKILNASPDVCELAQLSVPSDGYWIDRLVETCEIQSKLNDKVSFLRQALSAPLRAAKYGVKSVSIFDDLENADHLSSQMNLVEDLKEIYSRSENPFVFAGKRRFVFKAAQKGQKRLDDIGSLELSGLSFNDAGTLAENLATQYDIRITDQTRDLISHQFKNSPPFIRFLFQTAHEKAADLDSFQRVEEAYAGAILGGKMKGFYDSIFDEIEPKVEVQRQLISLLHNAVSLEKQKSPVESWAKHLDLSQHEFYRVMKALNTSEITRQTSNMVEVMGENETLGDYIETRFRLEVNGDSRSLVVAESLSEFLKRAPINMARFYKGSSALGIREIMEVFDCQEIPTSLIEYEKFKQHHKGKTPDQILADIKSEDEKLALPQIVYTAHTVSLYSPISKLTESERSAVALGFEAADYKNESEVVWIAAEIDSKLEATEELAAFWCDRLEMVALMCDFARYRLWLVSPEGFTPEAVELLKDRNALGSSRAQTELLAKFLGAESILANQPNPNEYELVLPMGEDTELIAAHAAEDIARRHAFGPKAINQIKTALIEACINASEHSHSPDRKIYQKFAIEDDKLVITISNRGLRFKGKETKEIGSEDGRRGWGLKLIKSLMDDVKFEDVDDGTRISMTKKLVR